MHVFARSGSGKSDEKASVETRGLVLNWGWRYDLMVWFIDLVSRGKIREVRRRTLDWAELGRGEAVLDVGCGTGTLALEAYQRVGERGQVVGIDPAPQQIARARSKARSRGLPIDFRLGVIEQLPFPDHSFNVALSTLMMHHLPDDLKCRGLAEIARVLKPSGRLVIVDAVHAEHRGQAKLLGVGELGIQDQPALLKEAGFAQIETAEMPLTRLHGFSRVGFVLARKAPA